MKSVVYNTVQVMSTNKVQTQVQTIYLFLNNTNVDNRLEAQTSGC